jgi:hypothetical protein
LYCEWESPAIPYPGGWVGQAVLMVLTQTTTPRERGAVRGDRKFPDQYHRVGRDSDKVDFLELYSIKTQMTVALFVKYPHHLVRTMIKSKL